MATDACAIAHRHAQTVRNVVLALRILWPQLCKPPSKLLGPEKVDAGVDFTDREFSRCRIPGFHNPGEATALVAYDAPQ